MSLNFPVLRVAVSQCFPDLRGCEVRKRDFSVKIKFFAKRELTTKFDILQNRCCAFVFLLFN